MMDLPLFSSYFSLLVGSPPNFPASDDTYNLKAILFGCVYPSKITITYLSNCFPVFLAASFWYFCVWNWISSGLLQLTLLFWDKEKTYYPVLLTVFAPVHWKIVPLHKYKNWPLSLKLWDIIWDISNLCSYLGVLVCGINSSRDCLFTAECCIAS